MFNSGIKVKAATAAHTRNPSTQEAGGGAVNSESAGATEQGPFFKKRKKPGSGGARL